MRYRITHLDDSTTLKCRTAHGTKVHLISGDRQFNWGEGEPHSADVALCGVVRSNLLAARTVASCLTCKRCLWYARRMTKTYKIEELHYSSGQPSKGI